MGAGQTLLSFTAQNAEPPSSNYATPYVRNRHVVYHFDDGATETVYFSSILPRNYAGGGVRVNIQMANANAGDGSIKVRWETKFERIQADVTDLDSAPAWGSAETVDIVASTTSGVVVTGYTEHADGAEMDYLAAGEALRLSVSRLGADAADDMSGDAQLFRVEIQEQP